MKLINGGIYENKRGDRITVVHLDDDAATYTQDFRSGITYEEEETTRDGLRAELKGYRLVRMIP